MAGIRLRLEDVGPMEVEVDEFVTRRSGHGHLFKHVIPLEEPMRRPGGSHDDPERWNEVIPDPPLQANPALRKRKALEKLAAIEGCLLGRSRRKDRQREISPCRRCRDPEAMARVDIQFGPLLSAYVGAARHALSWAAEHSSMRNPFLLAYRLIQRKGISIKFVDNRKIVGVGVLGTDTQRLRLLTCYRKGRNESLNSTRLDLCRERAGHIREGTLVEVRGDHGGED